MLTRVIQATRMEDAVARPPDGAVRIPDMLERS